MWSYVANAIKGLNLLVISQQCGHEYCLLSNRLSTKIVKGAYQPYAERL